MKVIDLLNKIANGEEVPKKIKIKQWEYNIEDENLEYELFDRLFEEDFELNDEVEILEEKKIPEKIQKDDFEGINEESKLWVAIRKINEILDYLKSKGE